MIPYLAECHHKQAFRTWFPTHLSLQLVTLLGFKQVLVWGSNSQVDSAGYTNAVENPTEGNPLVDVSVVERAVTLTLEYQINGGVSNKWGVQIFLKIDKQGGGSNNFRGGQDFPENCTNLRKSAFSNIQIQKINKQGGHITLGGGVKFFQKNKMSPPPLI